MARWLMDAFHLERFAVHAFQYDLVLRRNVNADAMQKTVIYTLKSSHVGAHKFAWDRGEIKI